MRDISHSESAAGLFALQTSMTAAGSLKTQFPYVWNKLVQQVRIEKKKKQRKGCKTTHIDLERSITSKNERASVYGTGKKTTVVQQAWCCDAPNERQEKENNNLAYTHAEHSAFSRIRQRRWILKCTRICQNGKGEQMLEKKKENEN